MRCSMTAIIVFIFIVIFSIFVANFADIVNTDKEISEKLSNGKKSKLLDRQKALSVGNGTDHLMWFVQISDLHISIFQEVDRIEQFEEFVNRTVDVIRPKVVLASGDLTDAKDSNKLGSRQYLQEWQIYKGILDKSNIRERTVWLDIRGNHDYFNVPDIKSHLNYFRKFSIQGGQHQRSYLHQLTTGNDTYSFIAVDACLEPGPKRPFNFIGLLDRNETNHVIDLGREAIESGGNYTIWFGHYPTSCILTPGTGSQGIRGIIGRYDESYVYLSGHLHTQGGMVPRMYTLHKAGFLELELGDWKDNRLFRVAAFDHGLFSFVDVHFNEWPIVLVTNPKEALLNIPSRENPALQLDSTHIRILIFSPSPVTTCKVQIEKDGWNDCEQVSGNLFVVPWSPSKYRQGIHHMDVIVKTEDGASKLINHAFSLDGTRLSFDLLARFALMIDACQVFQAFFGLALAGCVVPLCLFRVAHELVAAGKCKRPIIRNLRLKIFVRKFWILSATNRLFIPLVVYCLYISLGPWAIGDVIDDHLGVIFVWGIFVNNAFLPGSLTYVYGFFQLAFCQFPLTWVYANEVNRSFVALSIGRKQTSKWRQFLTHLPFILIIFVEVVLAIFFWWAYGTMAFVLGPFRTWTIIFHIVMWYAAVNIPENCLKSSISIWQS